MEAENRHMYLLECLTGNILLTYRSLYVLDSIIKLEIPSTE